MHLIFISDATKKEVKLYLNPQIICNYKISQDYHQQDIIEIDFHSTIKDSKQKNYQWGITLPQSRIVNYTELKAFLASLNGFPLYKATQARKQAELSAPTTEATKTSKKPLKALKTTQTPPPPPQTTLNF